MEKCSFVEAVNSGRRFRCYGSSDDFVTLEDLCYDETMMVFPANFISMINYPHELEPNDLPTRVMKIIEARASK